MLRADKVAWSKSVAALDGVTVLCNAMPCRPAATTRRRPESSRCKVDRRAAVVVREAHLTSRTTYGSPRVHAELVAKGERVSRKRVVANGDVSSENQR